MRNYSEIAQAMGIGQDDCCPCGCGEATEYNRKTFVQKFRPGHDAKLVARLVRELRSGDAGFTWREAESYLEWDTRPALARKLEKIRSHFPKNGPTRKAARALIERCGTNGSGDSFVRRGCASRYPDTHKYHNDLEDCGIHMHLAGHDASQILHWFS